MHIHLAANLAGGADHSRRRDVVCPTGAIGDAAVDLAPLGRKGYRAH